jgi:hypothetical protein
VISRSSFDRPLLKAVISMIPTVMGSPSREWRRAREMGSPARLARLTKLESKEAALRRRNGTGVFGFIGERLELPVVEEMGRRNQDLVVSRSSFDKGPTNSALSLMMLCGRRTGQLVVLARLGIAALALGMRSRD